MVLQRALTIVLVGMAGCSCPGEAPREPPPAPVEVAQASRADVPETLDTIGTVESINTVEVRSRVSGQLLSIEFVPGQVVEEGDGLFRLDPRPFEHALESAEAALAEAKTQSGFAQAEAERFETLARTGAAATRLAEETRAGARAARAAVRAAEAAVENARLDLEYTHIRSPIQGRTGNLLVHIGDQIQANGTDPMVTIQVMNPIYVNFSVPADRLPTIQEAMSEGIVQVIAKPRGAEGEGHEGELTFIDNQVDLQTGTILLKGTFSNDDEVFWPGEPTDVELLVRVLRGVVVVPSAAIQVGQEGSHVFIVGAESAVELRPVRTGPSTNGMTAILEGVEEGETVVTSGQLRLQPGTKVRIQGQEQEP